tara:strand:- start:17815 stop:18468 length:654 start_codon:yes stop_codon:yes gene_type:complete
MSEEEGIPHGSPVRSGRAAQTAQYDPLIQQQAELRRLRQNESRRMDDLVNLYGQEPGRLREAQGVATNEMRRQAALRMASQGARGNIIGAASAAKMVGGEAENIGTRFGDQIRQAAEKTAQAKVERAQQAIESIAKPGVDVERISAELRSIVDRNKRSLLNKASFGYAGQAASPAARDAELDALARTTRDPLALQMIAQIRSNINQGRDPFDGMAQA